jgi:hypothetical protein
MQTRSPWQCSCIVLCLELTLWIHFLTLSCAQMYIQNASPDGPAAWAVVEVIEKLQRWADDPGVPARWACACACEHAIMPAITFSRCGALRLIAACARCAMWLL